MTITISKTFDFDAAHRLDRLPPEHKCYRLHGHTYRVEIQIRGDVDTRTGMVRDYADIAKKWRRLHDQLDHRYLNEIPGLEVPTTEVLAEWIAARIGIFGLHRVRVYESSTTWAQWTAGDS